MTNDANGRGLYEQRGLRVWLSVAAMCLGVASCERPSPVPMSHEAGTPSTAPVAVDASGDRGTSTPPALVPLSIEPSWPRIDPRTSGIHPDALATLMSHARDERSSAVIILKDGKIALEVYREGYNGHPLTAMSASKSVMSLAIGMLIADGKITESTRVDQLLPDWANLGPKSAITVRQLLTQTGGLGPGRNGPGETIREHARRTPLAFAPGTRWQYSNAGVDLLAALFKQAAGEHVDTYLDARLFRKLGARGTWWMKDREGTPTAAGELVIRPIDLARIGQLMLDHGKWQGEALVTSAWVERSTAPSQAFEADYGLLWWREGLFAPVLTQWVLDGWRDLGFDDKHLRGAKKLVGTRFSSDSDYNAALVTAVGSAWTPLRAAIKAGDHVPFRGMLEDGPDWGFSARGSGGQYIVVLPDQGVVGVRTRRVEPGEYKTGDLRDRHEYPAFATDVGRLFSSFPALTGHQET